MRTRDWRRHQRDRTIAHTERWMRTHGWFSSPYTRWEGDVERDAIRKNATTPHPCSGPCCGNPRRWFGALTMQERRAGIISDTEWLD